MALVENKTGQVVEVSNAMAQILKEFRGVMPIELPKELPPKCNIDHKIEMLPETKHHV